MESTNSGSTSSKISSGHSSEGHDDFLEDASKLGQAKTIMQERFRSRSLSHAPPRIIVSPDSIEPKLNHTQRFKPVFGRSVSVEAPETPNLFISSYMDSPRKRSKSYTGEISGLADRVVKQRIRKISTNSLGSFGRGFEGLLLAKPEVLISPVISPEPSPEVRRKEVPGEEVADVEDESKSKKAKQPHLDHGYAWVIVFGAGMAFFLGGGFGRCFPLIYQRLMERFQSSATATAWVAAMHGAVKLCSSKNLPCVICYESRK